MSTLKLSGPGGASVGGGVGLAGGEGEGEGRLLGVGLVLAPVCEELQAVRSTATSASAALVTGPW